MTLDGSLMILTAIMLTTFHPGWTLGEYWHTATFTLRTKKNKTVESAKFLGSENNSSTDLRQSTRYEALPSQGGSIPLPSYGQGRKYEPYRGEEA